MRFIPPDAANIVVMFPYPSGEGLHIGHYYNYAIIDSYCRYWRYRGKTIFQPFGYDAFGLPAENYARKIGGDPRTITYKNIENFRRQMGAMNTSYEERLITSDPSYYKWTQWLFLKLREHGLAYKKNGAVNWCRGCETVLANEQVIDGRCERCQETIVSKTMNQWYFKITNYKHRLLQNLDSLDYPAPTIKKQRNWLNNLHDWCVSRQRGWGCPIPLDGETDTLDTFVDSSFYYLRYLTDSSTEFLPTSCYRPLDLYVGGPEHATMHLIYARFIHMFLYDIGIVPQEEPFNKVIHQGIITNDGRRMSKSRGNVISPDDYEPAELRLALMFIGPYFEGGDWNEGSITGVRRFIRRFENWLEQAKPNGAAIDLGPLFNKIENNIADFKFNLIVSDFMKFFNENKNKAISLESSRELKNLWGCFCVSSGV